jgi:cellulose synthase/poly-beta-1,6-N-acetylglucosamine synthase-like glycosyltransferase
MPHRAFTGGQATAARTLTAVPRPWLSVVVPAYNEAPWIRASVEAMREALEALDRPWELIVVDNASPDGTAEALAALAEADERIRVLRNDVNRGKGYSVRRGMLAAAGELRLHCDADCAGSFASLPRLLEAVEHADLVVGSRLADGARLGRRQPLRRRIVGRSFVLLCRAVLQEPTTDLFCGFKLWRETAATAVYQRAQLDGWTFDAETLALARALGFRLREVGVEWSDREGSRLSMARVLVPVVGELAAARRHVRREVARAIPEPAEATSSAG